jgi:hypothetical protein
MKALWIFLILIVFCIYVLIGLHITEGLESGVQVVLSWVIYTLMCTTFLNVFILGYFWLKKEKKPHQFFILYGLGKNLGFCQSINCFQSSNGLCSKDSIIGSALPKTCQINKRKSGINIPKVKN